MNRGEARGVGGQIQPATAGSAHRSLARRPLSLAGLLPTPADEMFPAKAPELLDGDAAQRGRASDLR